MSTDPKAKFKKYVGAESGGGRPEGKGYITELQRQKLKPAHLEVIVTKNKERNHYPKRVSNEKWAKVKVELKRKQYQTKQTEGKNQKLKGVRGVWGFGEKESRMGFYGDRTDDEIFVGLDMFKQIPPDPLILTKPTTLSPSTKPLSYSF